jgi:hypothetical protein
MPKEFAHWCIAEETKASLKPQPLVASVSNYPATYNLGAVAHDSPFYAIGLPERELIKQTANELHGIAGEDTLDRFRLQTGLDVATPSVKLAFLAGALTHYAADVTIHPMVNYFCNGSPLRERRHRAFETCMDVHLMAKRAAPVPVAAGLGGLLREISREQASEVSDIVSRFYQSNGSIDVDLTWRMLKRHAAIRDRFDNSVLRGIVRGYAAVGGEAARVLAATFYPSTRKIHRILPIIDGFFASTIEFRHPRTGATVRANLEELMTTAADYAANLINDFFGADHRSENTEATADTGLSTGTGLSLDSGCDVRAFPDEIHYGNAEAMQNTGFFYE